MTKTIYIAMVSWREDGKRLETSLWGFEDKKNAEDYCKWKNEQAIKDGNQDRSDYYVEELTVWDYYSIPGKDEVNN